MNARMIEIRRMTPEEYDAEVRRRHREMVRRHFWARVAIGILRHPIVWWIVVQAVAIAGLLEIGE